MRGVIVYIDVSDVTLTAPTTVGTMTTVNTNMTPAQFNSLRAQGGIFAVRYKEGNYVYTTTATDNGSGLLFYQNTGLTFYRYYLGVSSDKVVLTGNIYKAAAPD